MVSKIRLECAETSINLLYVLLLLGGSKMVLGFLFFKWKMHLAYFRSGIEMDLSWGACESLSFIKVKNEGIYRL